MGGLLSQIQFVVCIFSFTKPKEVLSFKKRLTTHELGQPLRQSFSIILLKSWMCLNQTCRQKFSLKLSITPFLLCECSGLWFGLYFNSWWEFQQVPRRPCQSPALFYASCHYQVSLKSKYNLLKDTAGASTLFCKRKSLVLHVFLQVAAMEETEPHKANLFLDDRQRTLVQSALDGPLLHRSL